jgi:ATP-dependent DNA helicase PIF1
MNSNFREENLNEQQRRAYDAVASGKSIFLTGAGGTGKSYLLAFIYHVLAGRMEKMIGITAMTGCAALLLGRHAKTLHSWAAIGLAREPASVLAAQIKQSKAYRRWLVTDILVIDEVSMLTPELLEKLDEVAKIVRRNKNPMGGLQIVFVGDFFQLPPIYKDRDEKECFFAFESDVWKRTVNEMICLTQMIRAEDTQFQKILEEARRGNLSEESIALLKTREGLPWQNEKIRPTLLFNRRVEVDIVNERNLKALRGERHIFEAETVFLPIEATSGLTAESERVKHATLKLDRDAPYDVKLILATDAQVMLLVNLDSEAGLVNGSRGVVVGFSEGGHPIVQFKKGEPLTIAASTWESEELPGVQRRQIPLKLAYAMTTHKSQGATLDCALIDIGPTTFEYGQAYVALSRVRNLESLYIWELDPSAFRAHPKVLAFYQTANE